MSELKKTKITYFLEIWQFRESGSNCISQKWFKKKKKLWDIYENNSFGVTLGIWEINKNIIQTVVIGKIFSMSQQL